MYLVQRDAETRYMALRVAAECQRRASRARSAKTDPETDGQTNRALAGLSSLRSHFRAEATVTAPSHWDGATTPAPARATMPF
jgi:hypothetical protein